jgi:hypothetical protein
MYQTHTGVLPGYLIDSLDSCQNSVRRRELRSASSSNFVIPRLRTNFGKSILVRRSSGPHAWNSLPEYCDLLRTLSPSDVKSKLIFFNTAFNVKL